jgi:phosphoglycerate kinase
MGMRSFKTIDDLDVSGKRVLVRVDFNVPMKNGKVTDATRIERALPTIEALSKKGAKVILLSHLGRPDGKAAAEFSQKPVAEKLAEVMKRPVAFASDCIGAPARAVVGVMKPGDFAMLENTRFHSGEEDNDPAFITALAENGDVYVNDAFSAAHRAHASTEGLARALPSAAGRAMERELDYLAAALLNPVRPLMAIVGGAKVSTKIDLLTNLVEKADILVVGGGMANTFLAAQGIPVGKSLAEVKFADTAREIVTKAARRGCEIVLPSDVVVAREFKENVAHEVAGVGDVQADQMILDIGPQSVDDIAEKMETAKTLVWNGPVGAFETKPFDTGTVEAARFAAKLCKAKKLVAVAGGGDTVAALNAAGVSDDFTYVSTAGGAFLEWLEGKTLPGVAALTKSQGE